MTKNSIQPVDRSAEWAAIFDAEIESGFSQNEPTRAVWPMSEEDSKAIAKSIVNNIMEDYKHLLK